MRFNKKRKTRLIDIFSPTNRTSRNKRKVGRFSHSLVSFEKFGTPKNKR